MLLPAGRICLEGDIDIEGQKRERIKTLWRRVRDFSFVTCLQLQAQLVPDSCQCLLFKSSREAILLILGRVIPLQWDCIGVLKVRLHNKIEEIQV